MIARSLGELADEGAAVSRRTLTAIAGERRRRRLPTSPLLDEVLGLEGAERWDLDRYVAALRRLADGLKADVGWKTHRDALVVLAFEWSASLLMLERGGLSAARRQRLVDTLCDREQAAALVRLAASRPPRGRGNLLSFLAARAVWGARDDMRRARQIQAAEVQIVEWHPPAVQVPYVAGCDVARVEAASTPQERHALRELALSGNFTAAAAAAGMSRQALYRVVDRLRTWAGRGR